MRSKGLTRDCLSEADIERFLSRLEVRGITECWPFHGDMSANHGYPTLYTSEKGRHTKKAHQVSFVYFNGDIPAGKLVRHRCHNRVCANPMHLLLGTHKDNMQDALNADRVPRGENAARSRLTERDVEQMKILASLGRSRDELATMFGVNVTRVSSICLGRTWSHVRPELNRQPLSKSDAQKQFDDEDVRRIRYDRDVLGLTYSALVTKYGSSKTTIRMVLQRKGCYAEP